MIVFKDRDFTDEQVYFAIYCITILSCNWSVTPDEVYRLITEKTKILDNYIIKYYDTLHTQGEDYIVNEITMLLKNEEL